MVRMGVLVALGILGTLFGSGEQTATSSNPVASGNTGETATVAQDKSASEKPERAPSVSLTGSQANAARNAQQYLSMTGFSRSGLIEQLSSEAGSGYDVADATVAVDSLNIDWNEQAERSAKQYLEMTGFSCKGLIEQLSSDAGSQYTKAQARYGAERAGAC